MNWYKLAKEEIEMTDIVDGIDVSSKWIEIDSQWMAAVAYYAPDRRFEIKTKPRGNEEKGKEYLINGVTKEEFTAFMKAPSKGAFFNKILRPKYGVK